MSDVTAAKVAEAWFEGRASDEELIALFLPTRAMSPLQRLRCLAQTMNLATRMAQYTEHAILAEGGRTAQALQAMAKQPGEISMVEATKLALEDHFQALQMLVEGCEQANEERVIQALDLAEQADRMMRSASTAASVVSQHLERLPVAE